MSDAPDTSAFAALLAPLPPAHHVSLSDSATLYPAQHAAGANGLPMLVVENELGRAVVTLQGAHLMAFQPKGQREMLWVSPKCVFAVGQPIRGGIPLCLPWFGPGPDGKSMHGFARTRPWTLVGAEALAGGETRLVLELSGDTSTNALWPHAFVFQLTVVVGKELRLELSVQNTGPNTAPLAFAFHTYFAVPDVATMRVGGLDGTTFIDKLDNAARKIQTGGVTITAPTDRIYLDVAARQTLSSGDAGTTAIQIDSDMRCAVVWNAWTNDRNIPDLGEGNHIGYLCVERCDVADHAVALPADGIYRARMTLSF